MIASLKRVIRKSNFLSIIYNELHLLKTRKIEKEVRGKLIAIENLSENELFNMQNKMLLKILSYAYENTEYYKLLFDKNKIDLANFDELKRIPFLSKEIIKKNTVQLISKKFDIKNLGKRNTGGSTGEPLEFYCNTEAGLIDYGHHSYLYSLMGYKNTDLILSCGGIEVPASDRNKGIFWVRERKGNLFGDYRFSVLYLTDDNIKLYINKLIELKPSILRGYPSFFDRMARYLLDEEIKLDFTIKGINLTSEICTNSQRETIEKAFSSMVYFEYGHNEISLYCYTKDNTYTYQSSPIYGYIEVLNDNGTDTDVGEVGNIVATGFNNRGMPFIRYRTGDLGELSYRNGGIVHFKTIYGRLQDFILSKQGQKVYLTALIFGQHLKAFANITKWQIIQNKVGEIEIHIIKGNAFSSKDEMEIKKKIQSVTDIDIIFKYVDNIPLTKRGKHLFLKQNIKFK